ncbi:MAG: NACHT and WD repeat domain-containing protein, partial [Egibacteraceae bacterium]
MLVAAACMPMVWPLVGNVPKSVEEFVALFGSVGSGYLGNFLKEALTRLRQKGGEPTSQDEFREALEHDLDACLVADDERTAGLRADMAVLLQRVHGVEVALESTSGDVQVALSKAFAELGGHFVEFRWMLDETHQTVVAIQQEQAHQGAVLRHQTDLAREQLTKTNEVLHWLKPSAAPPVTPGPEPEEEDPSPAPGPCPYKGLETFQPEDAEWFFGREELVAQLAARLSETPFLAVLGPSGSGKSSVLRAGLLPAVWRGLLPEASTWTTVVLTPGAHPLEELALRISLVRGVAPGSLLADLQTSPGHLRLAVRQALLDAPPGARVLLVVDQFEEIFALCRDEVERRRFLEAVVDLADDPDSPAKVVLAIRADFYARCAEYPELVGALQDNQALVGPMSTANLRRAIEGPAARAGIALEPGLVETVLDDLGDEPGSLPLLSHALFETWERRRGRTLTLAGYQDAGGVRQAIAQTAETVYGTLDPAQQGIAKDVFLRLTALGEGTEDTRRRAQRAELLDGRDTETVELVLNRLAEARLVTLDEDSVEVAHEALIRGWPKLRSWINDDREALRAHRRLTEAASEWDQNGREEGFLYRGARLAAWQDRPLEPLNDLERAFLAASREREARERVAKRRRVRLTVIGLSAMVVLALLQAYRAVDQRNLALSRQVTANATVQLSSDPELGLLLARKAFEIRPTGEAEAALRQATLESRVRARLRGHKGGVFGAAFSPDGRRVVSVGGDGAVRVWDLVGGRELVVLRGHQGSVL